MDKLIEAMEFKMPYGEYRDCTLEEIPMSYLHWIAADFKDERIAKMADIVYQWRKDNGE